MVSIKDGYSAEFQIPSNSIPVEFRKFQGTLWNSNGISTEFHIPVEFHKFLESGVSRKDFSVITISIALLVWWLGESPFAFLLFYSNFIPPKMNDKEDQEMLVGNGGRKALPYW